MTSFLSTHVDVGADDREFLLTNARADFAFGRLDRVPTRQYHSLLTSRWAAAAEPVAFLSEVNEVLHIDGATYELANFQYEEGFYPHGFRHLKSVEVAHDRVEWSYDLEGVRIQRELRLHPDASAIDLRYQLTGMPAGARLFLSPYFGIHHWHSVSRATPYLRGQPTHHADGWAFRFFDDVPELWVALNCTHSFEASGFWNRTMKLRVEAERGYDASATMDSFCPGAFALDPPEGECVVVLTISLQERQAALPEPTMLPQGTEVDLQESLRAACTAFRFRDRNKRPGVIAGYPWFGRWGRDTMIAFGGLYADHESRDEAQHLLGDAIKDLTGGGLANMMPEDGSPRITSIDAALWLFRAVWRASWALDIDVAPWLPALHDFLDGLTVGAQEGIWISEEGLLYADRRPQALTWMDAIVDGQPVTPRAPCAVELQGLYGFALDYLAGESTGVARREYRDRLKRLRESFERVFWLPGSGYFADSFDGSALDTSLRPNQLLAAAPRRLMTKAQGRQMLQAIRSELVTPVGLRTLSPADPAYRGRCVGDQRSRDLAYHQGTVWPWLIGPYLDAVCEFEGQSAARREFQVFLPAMKQHLQQAAIGFISEIFDGDAPHTPRGAPAQAWSCSELYRVLTNLGLEQEAFSRFSARSRAVGMASV